MSVGQVVRAGSLRVELPPDQALELFTARGEVAWAPGWEPRYVWPADGTPVAGGIWLTRDGDVEVIWRVQRFDRAAREAEYLRVVPGSRVAVVEVRCAPEAERATRAHVTYRVVPLSDAGHAWLATFGDADYAAMMGEWERLIAASLVRS